MKAFQRLLVAAPAAALLPAVMAPISGLANEHHLDLDSVQEYSIAQGATIRDFSDVYPTDWAYQALAELVETYGCVSGYPDGTFRGQQPITRFEMAAILSKCLDSISAKLEKMEMMGDSASMEDMETLERLTASFEEELITLKGTVDGLDARMSELEDGAQFSTTTKAKFEIATDFVYFSAKDEEARGTIPGMEKYTYTIREERPQRTLKPMVPAVPEMKEQIEAMGPVAATQEVAAKPRFWHPYLIPGTTGTGSAENASTQNYSNFTGSSLGPARDPLNSDGNSGNDVEAQLVRDFLPASDYLLLRVEKEESEDAAAPTTYKFRDGDRRTGAASEGIQISRVIDNSSVATATVSAPSTDQDSSILESGQKAILVKRPTITVKFYKPSDNKDEGDPWILVGDRTINEASGDITKDFTIPMTDAEINKQINDGKDDTLTLDKLMAMKVEKITQEGKPAEPAIIQPAVPAITEEREREVQNPITEDNSGIAMSSSVKVAFETSFTGSDKLTFALEGDVMSMENHYLGLGNFYDVADNGHTNVKFKGFKYERGFDLGGIMTTLTLGTDVDDFDPLVGMSTYYPGGGYDGFGPSDFGDTGIGASVEFISGDAGTMTGSFSYAVDGDHAASQSKGKHGIFGKETDRSIALALNWDGPLFAGNDAMFTVAYQNINMESMMPSLKKNYWHIIAGTYFTDTISLSGSYSFGKYDYDSKEMKDMDKAQWMIGVNFDDAIFPGNSAGIAYGTPDHTKNMKKMNGMNYSPTQVLELYYSFAVNDSFEVPVYLDFISNAGNPMNGNGTNKSAFALAIRPTLTF